MKKLLLNKIPVFLDFKEKEYILHLFEVSKDGHKMTFPEYTSSKAVVQSAWVKIREILDEKLDLVEEVVETVNQLELLTKVDVEDSTFLRFEDNFFVKGDIIGRVRSTKKWIVVSTKDEISEVEPYDTYKVDSLDLTADTVWKLLGKDSKELGAIWEANGRKVILREIL